MIGNRINGRVETYYRKKNYGFIRGDDSRKYFVHSSEINLPSKSLDAGYSVNFISAITETGWQAKDVNLI